MESIQHQHSNRSITINAKNIKNMAENKHGVSRLFMQTNNQSQTIDSSLRLDTLKRFEEFNECSIIVYQ